MSNTITYNTCIIISCMFEIYFAFSFYRAFHEPRDFFCSKLKLSLSYIVFVVLNVCVNMQHNTMYNVVWVALIYLSIMFVMFSGGVGRKIVHWLMLFFLSASAELIFALLQSLPFNVPTNQVFDNEFFMVSSIFAVKMLHFILLSVVKQISKHSSEKLDMKLFSNYLIIPVATVGVMFAIPYIRVGGRENTVMDIILIMFYILLLVGNVTLFYMFSKYSKMKEQQMLQEISKAKYEEQKKHYDAIERMDEKHKELIHNIDHYLRQIGIYAEHNQVPEIKEVLSDLRIEFVKSEKEIICANGFLNSLLMEFKERAMREAVSSKIFVEAGFKVEFMKEIDLTAVLGNLSDNALEAAKKCENGEVCLDFFMQNQGALAVIRIENNYKGEVLEKDGNLVSTKEDNGLHGIGIKSVRSIVEKYNGYMQQEFSTGIYKTTLVIPTSNLTFQ